MVEGNTELNINLMDHITYIAFPSIGRQYERHEHSSNINFRAMYQSGSHQTSLQLYCIGQGHWLS